MKFKKINISKLFDNRSSSSCSADWRTDRCRGACHGEARCKASKPYGSEDTRSRFAPCSSVKNNAGGTSCRSSEPYVTDANGTRMRDRGNEPIVFDIRKEAFMTPEFRTALWTGGNLQLTVMTLPEGEEIGVEMHESLDQLIGVVSGAGEVSFGNRENYLAPPLPLDAHSVVLVPAGTYHNVKNVGKTPLKLYSVYAPKAHKFGTVEKNKG